MADHNLEVELIGGGNMTIDPTQWQIALKCNVFHYFDCLSNPQPILDLIAIANETFQHIEFDAKVTANRLGNFKPRDLKPTPRNWSKVLSEIQQGKTSTLLYGSLASHGYGLQVGIFFHMFNEEYRRREPGVGRHYDSMGLWVEDTLLRDGIVTLEMCSHLMTQGWEKLHGVYAFADIFATHQTGLISPKREQEDAYAMKAKVGSYEIGNPHGSPQTNVPDAYWLNFLNKTHVEKLSGIERIKANLPHAQIEYLPYEGVSIQISPSPIYDSIEMWQSDHLAAEKVLAPILPKKAQTA